MDSITSTVTITEQDVGEVLANSALLVAFHQSTWTGEASDAEAVAKIKKDAGAAGDVGKFRKNLLANNDEALKKVVKAISAAYRDHVRLTLPWGNSQYRLLPNAGFLDYARTIQGHKTAITSAVDELIAVYPDKVEAAIVSLGGLADRSQYPTAEQVRAKFGIDVDFDPVPGAKGFPGLPPQFAAALQQQLDIKVAARMKDAVADMWEQIRALLNRFANQTRADGKVYESTVEEVLALPERVRRFNIMGDAQLSAVADVVQKDLGYDAKSLKVDATKAWVHQRVQQIVAVLPS